MTGKHEIAYEQLKDRLVTISGLRSRRASSSRTSRCTCPEEPSAGRAEQVATPSRLSHEMLVNEATARLLDSVGEPDPSSEEGALVRRVR
jgi:Zn-dependent M32 family carboxypeptidase